MDALEVQNKAEPSVIVKKIARFEILERLA